MVRTQIQLSEEHARALKAAASREGVSMAELIRRSLDAYLRVSERDALIQRALDACGGSASGTGDVADRHDELFAEAAAR